jgi:ABC-type bacteriocin/lantibiotic exporter with double-glycine peptidase domain
MVLDYYGIRQPEAALRRMCKAKFFGTHPINVVTTAREFGLESYADTAELPKLAELLKQNIPPIVTTFAEQEETIISHALVVQKIKAKYVYVLDPAEGERELEAELRAAGAKVWVDHAGIRSGDNLPKRISDALEWCNMLLLMLFAEDNRLFGYLSYLII